MSFEQKAQQEIEKLLGKCNILVIGKSGVGKSTLLNVLFGDEFAKTDKLHPCTDELKKYCHPDIPISIYDSRGLEIPTGNIFNLILNNPNTKTQKNVDQLLGENKRKLIQDQVHLIWYCIKEGNKFETIEQEWLKKLSKYNIPILLLVTQCEKHDQEYIKELEKCQLPVQKIVAVLAQPSNIQDHVIDSYGLDNLVKETEKLLPDISKNAFGNALADLNLKSYLAMIVCVRSISSTFIVGGYLAPTLNHCITIPVSQALMLYEISHIFGVKMNVNFLSGFGHIMEHIKIGIGAEVMFSGISQYIPVSNVQETIDYLSNSFKIFSENTGLFLFTDNFASFLPDITGSFSEQIMSSVPFLGGISSALTTFFFGSIYIDTIKKASEEAIRNNEELSFSKVQELFVEAYETYIKMLQDFFKDSTNYHKYASA